jgi:NAD-dependent DNA ligase (contains BRCT domain type II)
MGVHPREEKIIHITDSAFSGKNVVLTGTLSEPREVWKKRLILAGANISSGVSSKTDFVLAGENAGSKLEKAEKMELLIIAELDAMNLLENKK